MVEDDKIKEENNIEILPEDICIDSRESRKGNIKERRKIGAIKKIVPGKGEVNIDDRYIHFQQPFNKSEIDYLLSYFIDSQNKDDRSIKRYLPKIKFDNKECIMALQQWHSGQIKKRCIKCGAIVWVHPDLREFDCICYENCLRGEGIYPLITVRWRKTGESVTATIHQTNIFNAYRTGATGPFIARFNAKVGDIGHYWVNKEDPKDMIFDIETVEDYNNRITNKKEDKDVNTLTKEKKEKLKWSTIKLWQTCFDHHQIIGLQDVFNIPKRGDTVKVVVIDHDDDEIIYDNQIQSRQHRITFDENIWNDIIVRNRLKLNDDIRLATDDKDNHIIYMDFGYKLKKDAEEKPIEEPKVETLKPIEEPKVETLKPIEEPKVETPKHIEEPKVEIPKHIEEPKVVDITNIIDTIRSEFHLQIEELKNIIEVSNKDKFDIKQEETVQRIAEEKEQKTIAEQKAIVAQRVAEEKEQKAIAAEKRADDAFQRNLKLLNDIRNNLDLPAQHKLSMLRYGLIGNRSDMEDIKKRLDSIGFPSEIEDFVIIRDRKKCHKCDRINRKDSKFCSGCGFKF